MFGEAERDRRDEGSSDSSARAAPLPARIVEIARELANPFACSIT